ncbi:hypothetical protein F5X99DRAFT_407137 [Biscogniauxia marginata]|nr:hypothetical protein F5X99DRAFT_407137 [Biscogniauxia marginata]
MTSQDYPLTPKRNTELSPKGHSLPPRPPNLPPKPPVQACFNARSSPSTPTRIRQHEYPHKPRIYLPRTPGSHPRSEKMSYIPRHQRKLANQYLGNRNKQELSIQESSAILLTPPKQDSYSPVYQSTFPTTTNTLEPIHHTATPHEDPTENKLKEIDAKLLAGAKTLDYDEQMLLWDHIDPESEKFGHTIKHLATQLSNRIHQLTYKITYWYYIRGNMAMVDQLLRERLNYIGEDWGNMMSLDAIDELMDCQIALDLVQEKLHGETEAEK